MSRLVARRYFLLALAAFGLVGYELLPRDDRRISSLLEDLCAKLNQTRDPATLAELQAALRASLLPEVVIQGPELGSDLTGPDAVEERARELLTVAPLSFSLSDVDVRVSGALARVTANLIVTVRGSGEQQRELRFTEVRLRQVGAQWRIERVNVEPVRPAEPEARP
ncbi:MAG TPA: nuclear transport factor 2 family protein [Polyangiaceae bacterium]|nr:nuclear transport factor 2 family protein [Polyangiaceae bacterium]